MILLQHDGRSGNLTNDAHLAAVAIERGGVLHSANPALRRSGVLQSAGR
ncbi:MAG: hypothetical protein LAT56_04200 [Wenzhouxiangella sp.]|nr:hypothetical protein [Wenzhouxiangella sp.]